MTTRRIVVRGRVQGVWFRDWTIREAQALGVSGWVRNRRDGSVELLASGEERAVTALADKCRSGPPAARVAEVVVGETDEQAPEGFARRPTA